MEDNPELNAFRRQWREEVSRRNNPTSVTPKQAQSAKPVPQDTASESSAHEEHIPPISHQAAGRKDDGEDEEDLGRDYGEFVNRTEQLTLRSTADEDSFQRLPQKEPRSAMEHFEKAVEREEQGNLGDSLAHYRKAYKLDAAIDKKYRNKHFANKPPQAPTTTSLEAASNKTEDVELLPTPELILTFAHLPIPPAEPIIEGDIPPPCPIAKIPNDILIEIMRHIALMDPASLCRMALVCKRFAYHFAHEQHVWKRLCQGHEFGFLSMHYSFNCDILGNPYHSFSTRYTPFPQGVPVSLPEDYSNWSQVFQSFPRIRFTGIYISTVNYTRPGGASSYANATWNDPIHIVTYYRYLRFYPDGSVISLVSTTEPMDVVPHINKENVAAARNTAKGQHSKKKADTTPHDASAGSVPAPHIAMQALKSALRGRWRLTRPDYNETQDLEKTDRLNTPVSAKDKVPENDTRNLVIETEGPYPTYTYVLNLGLRSTNPARAVGSTKPLLNASKNTKLVWRSFWSYNKLTDDWGEFQLRNDRSFVFRRVRGWGL